MGIVKEKMPLCTLDLSESGHSVRKMLLCTHGLSESGYIVSEDAASYPRLVLMWVQRRKIYRSVPIILVSEGTTPD